MIDLRDKQNETTGHDKTLSWSKIMLIFTGMIFLSCILFVFYMYISNKIDSGYDTTVIATCITVTGTLFGSNLCWYSKKAASENHYKLRMGLYADSAKIRLQFNEEMMKLKQEYCMSEDDIADIDNQGDIDDMMDSAIQDVISDLDATKEDADSPNQIESL
jgi:hypothetical protein